MPLGTINTICVLLALKPASVENCSSRKFQRVSVLYVWYTFFMGNRSDHHQSGAGRHSKSIVHFVIKVPNLGNYIMGTTGNGPGGQK